MHTNRLVHEKSPYLLQHAHNPVDWRPWGEEAFEEARREDKPIFLSVGYSTCHWCHVMERESFESASTARLLNEHFVPVKVDREERPDVDRIYMTFVQASTGGGGWPMSVWLTPDLKPFFGGTYFPPADAYGRPGFPAVLKRLAEAWKTDRARILESAASVIRQLENHLSAPTRGPAALDASVLDAGYQMFRRAFDPRRGGFGGPPKFPRPVTHNFLLRYYARTGNDEALNMVLKTLREMAAGGMNDQLAGGFHRYSVDEQWFVPHFEKMLYDQAQLALSYIEAFQITGDTFYAGVARETLDYVLRDMTHPDGAFYSAEDADSVIDPDNPRVKGEGAFYIWSAEEIASLLGDPLAEWFSYRYGVIRSGNVDAAHDPHGEFTGKNILYEARSVDETAARFDRPSAEVQAGLAESRRILFEARGRRVRPHLDDKILTAWNALMISAFSAAAQAFGEERYANAARRAADFVLGRMYRRGERLLMRRHRDGETAIAGFLDDYALFANALFDVYEVTFDCGCLETAVELAGTIVQTFEDRERGGFFSTAEGDSSLVLRMKDDYDGAEPSGNAAAMMVLLRAAALTGRADFRDAAGRALASFAAGLRSAPITAPQMLVALDMSLSTPRQIVLAAGGGGRDTLEFRREIGRRFLPYRTLLVVDSASRERLAALQPAVREMAAADGKTTAYVCRNYVCQLPVTELGAFRELLQ